MIIEPKDYGPHCTVEIAHWDYNRPDFQKLVLYSDNIVEAMEKADQLYEKSGGLVEVSERDLGRWKVSYVIQQYHGWVKALDEITRQEAEEWALAN